MDDEAELITLYKKFLRIENHRLRLKHQAGGGGREIAQQRAVLVDIVLRHLYRAAAKAAQAPESACGIALVAIGGFGRGELSPCSDVDLMFLHECREVPEQIGGVIEAILRTLWDVGFKVGHSTRSVEGAIKQANVDMLSKTSLLESRFIVGDRKLYERFKAEFEKKCIEGHEKEYVAQRIENQKERHQKNGNKITMQEPNVKSGCGSLRDYQNLIWVSIFTQRAESTAKLVSKKLLPESERRRLDRAYDFLLRVRTELHYHTKREVDTLSLIYQLPVATKLGYAQKSPLRRIEAFMRDYYRHTRDIFQITESTAAKLSLPGEEPRKGVLAFLKRKKKRECFDGFYLAEGRLFPESREIFKEDPFRMMRVFQHAQLRHADFSPELQILVRRNLPLVDRTYCYARAARETFSAILSRKGEVGRIVRLMHECDFLGKYLPEFAPMTCLVQHEFFHRYTADEHTLVCLEKLDELIDTQDEKLKGYRDLFQKIEDPLILYLAMLLHDVGKASNARYHADASAMAASRIAARLQLTSEQRKMLILLVDQHILLSSTAQRRNLEDPATISEFADAIRNQPYLDALMLVTLADGMGIGDNAVWSDWKESLVWQLYRSTSHYLAEGEAFFEQRAQQRRTTQEAVLKRLGATYAAEVEAHFQFMPETYFNTFEENSIASHIRLFRAFFEARGADGLAPAVRWIPRPDRGHSELWVCTWDRKYLLSKIAGALAIAHLNILSADIYTRGDSLVFDVFRVCDTRFQAVTNAKDTQLVEATLKESLSREDFDFHAALKKAMDRHKSQLSQELDFPTHIGIDNDTHPVYTVIDIQTPDRLGLLYNILRGFSEVGLNIALSRIATEKGAAIDSFYVTNAKGAKITGTASIERLQQILQRATERARAELESVAR